MSDDKPESKATPAAVEAPTAAPAVVDSEQERSEKILKAKELYSQGSRNFLVKSYSEAADELSQVCALYEELHGELSNELGMPYLLYAKSLIALALDENKVIDVPDEEEGDDDDDEDDEEEGEGEEEDEAKEKATNGVVKNGGSSEANGEVETNGKAAEKLDSIAEVDDGTKADEADSTADVAAEKAPEVESSAPEKAEEAVVSSTDDKRAESAKNGTENGVVSGTSSATSAADAEKPSTSNGDAENGGEAEEEENEAASNLQLAWEILELAAKIFSRQGLSGLANLAEVQTELANIEFENSILDSAREDYEKALKIYAELPTNYRRAMAEIHYKIGLTYLMQQANKEGAESLKEACALIDGEIQEIKAKDQPTEKDKNNIQDMEETKQEIWAKIAEIEETQAQNAAEVRAALDSYIKPIVSESVAGGSSSSTAAEGGASSVAASSSSSSAISSSSKPTDISHLIKRKKPEEPTSEAEAAASSPAKRPAL